MTGGEEISANACVAPGRSTTDGLLAEAVELAQAVRALLLTDNDRRAVEAVAPLARLERAAKLGELTTLLGYGVAWLLTRKAVEAGELSAAEARAPDRRLGTMQPVAMAVPHAEDALGRRLVELDCRVRALHERLGRLDRLLDEQH